MEREAHKSRSFADADRWTREQMWAMTPDERLAIAKELRDRAFGKDAPDVRESGHVSVRRGWPERSE
jgi:hypothetical protein